MSKFRKNLEGDEHLQSNSSLPKLSINHSALIVQEQVLEFFPVNISSGTHPRQGMRTIDRSDELADTDEFVLIENV